MEAIQNSKERRMQQKSRKRKKRTENREPADS